MFCTTLQTVYNSIGSSTIDTLITLSALSVGAKNWSFRTDTCNWSRGQGVYDYALLGGGARIVHSAWIFAGGLDACKLGWAIAVNLAFRFLSNNSCETKGKEKVNPNYFYCANFNIFTSGMMESSTETAIWLLVKSDWTATKNFHNSYFLGT